MFDNLLEKIQRVDEIENKLLIKQRKATERVCHIYDMTDIELLEFYGNVILNPKHYVGTAGQKQLPEDKAEVEKEIEKRGLGVKENGKKFQMVGGISGSIKEFFEHKSCGRDARYLIAYAQSRFAPSKLSDVLCEEVKVNETIADRIWDFLRENPDSTYNEILDGIDATGEDAGKFGGTVKDMLNKSIYVEDGKYHVVESLDEK